VTTLPAGRQELRHGYRLDDIRRYALMAAASRYTPHTLPHPDRVDIAWGAIVEHLYAAADYPSPTHLCHVGTVAISRATNREAHHAATSRAGAPMPHAARYWTRPAAPWWEDLVERIALSQVLALVRPREREALIALAACGTRRAAAEALGLSDQGLQSRLARARQRIEAAWYEGETPPARRRDRRVGAYRTEAAA
jgi:hypothetical protein